MKRIGIIYDSSSKKVFLLPEQVKALTSKGIIVNVLSGVGKNINIADSMYLQAGAQIFEQWSALIEASDIVLKTNAFNQKEISKMGKKVGLTMANFLANVDMLFYMLQSKATGLEWSSLASRNGYVFFQDLEELKAPFIMKEIKDALAKGLAKKPKDKLVYKDEPNMLILNATFAGVALAKLALDAGYNVTLADNDLKYCRELKSSGLDKLNIVDGNYETLQAQIRENHIFVNTCINPSDATKTRITKQMAESMPKGALLVDMACENGYAFHFMKKLALTKPQWNKVEKCFYLAIANITDLMPLEASKIISKYSVEYLAEIAQKGAATSQFNKITYCENGKVTNPIINMKLNLY